MKQMFIPILLLFGLACQNQQSSGEYSAPSPKANFSNPAHALVAQMVDAIGGWDQLYAQNDVEYTYTYRAPDGKEFVTTERYMFEGELSWASFSKRELFVLPEQEGEVIQCYDGKNTTTTIAGKTIQDEPSVKMADFMRKTNYYWFAMMFKLLDPGLNYEMLPEAEIDGIKYHVVKVTFNENVGDVQDIYQLYINPDTKLVDQFLFTVMDFGAAEPNLMKIEYEVVNGLKLMAYRKYAPCDWDGNIKEDLWSEQFSKNVRFNNGFTVQDFNMEI